MKQQLFRALKDDVSNCNFVYGQLVYDAISIPRITEIDKSGQGLLFHTCIKGTEGMSLGINDKDGKQIFQGDILISDSNQKYVVTWIEQIAGFYLSIPNTGRGREIISCAAFKHLDEPMHLCSMKIIGNVHENINLLNP